MVKDTTAGHEDLVKLLVVVDHHAWLWGLLGHGEEVVNILDGPKGLLPQFQLDGGVQLSETGVKESLEGVWIR